MNTKLTTPAQVARLRTGDIIRQFPFNCNDAPQDIFDERQPKHIGTYEIRLINLENDIFLLVSANVRTQILAAPVDIGRLYIKATDLITQNVWWVNT